MAWLMHFVEAGSDEYIAIVSSPDYREELLESGDRLVFEIEIGELPPGFPDDRVFRQE